MMNPEINLDQMSSEMLILVGILLAVAVVPVVLPYAVRFAPAVGRRVAAVCPWLVCRPFAPVVAAWRALRRRMDPAAEERREMGRYLAALPPHSGLTAHEEMARDIAALPPCAAKAALKEYFKKVAPPSNRAVWRARRQAGKPRVPSVVVNALLRGEVPPVWVRGKGWRKAVAV